MPLYLSDTDAVLGTGQHAKHGVESLPRIGAFGFFIMPPSRAGKSVATRWKPWKGIGCTEDPFRTGFHDEFVYLNADQRDRYDHLRRNVEARQGLSLITGPTGSGKTTLLRKLVADLQASDPLILFFATPITTLDALLNGCREQAGITEENSSESADPMLACREFLSGFTPERSPLLLIDEAQSLPDKILVDLLALGMPGAKGKSLLPIIMAGDYSLARRLALEPLRRRAHAIGYRYKVSPLAKQEVAAFIRHRLRAAGCSNNSPFADDAVERIADYANGVLGTLNTLCRLALFFAAEGEKTHVTVRSVELAASAALLSREPLGTSQFRMPMDSRPERRDQTTGEALKPVPLGKAPPSVSTLDSAAPSPGPNGTARAVDVETEGAAPTRPRPRRAWAWFSAGATALLAIGVLTSWFPEFQQVRSPTTNAERGAGLDAYNGESASPTGNESPSPGTDTSATADAPATETSSPAVAEEAPVASGSEGLSDARVGDRNVDPEPNAYSLEPMDTAYELRSTIAVREQPAVDSVTIATLSKGNTIGIRSQIRGSNWYLIDIPDGKSGFIYATLVPYPSPTEVAQAKTGAGSLGLIQLDETEAQAPEIGRLLTLADEHMRADRLVAPRFENALAVFRKILGLNPGNPEALDGLAAIKAKLMAYAQAEATRGDAASANRQLNKIQSIDKGWGTASHDSYKLTEELDDLGLTVPSVSPSEQ